jgi:beta-glucosidase
MRVRVQVTLLLVAASFCTPGSATAQSADARAKKLVGQMTLDEKLEELHGISDATHFRYVPGIARLGIPPLRVANGPAGVGPAGDRPQLPATALPAPISLAATWDVNAAHLYGVIIGKEARDLRDGLLEGPDINIMRAPQNGRTFEAYGEDPYLTGQIAVQVIQGIQSQHVIANVKHYDANNQETGRFKINEVIGERALHEIYLPAFHASVQQGQVASVMCAYPRVNGAFNCQNELLLNQILKGRWRFSGFVTSDFGATHSTVPSALTGLDLEMPAGKYFGDDLKAAVESGKVPKSVIDDKLVRRFRTMMEIGVFDHPPQRAPIPAKQDGAVACRLAEEGMVLLKNTGGLLPLNPARLRSIAVIGPYAAQAMAGGGGSSRVTPLYSVDPVEGIRRRAGPHITVNFADGGEIPLAAVMARSADVAIVMVGDRETEGRDHPISLSDNQDQLIEAVARANPHTIVVLKTGSPVLMPWADRVPAILEAWYPGEEDGNAAAAPLFGDVDPSGRLPVTFPKTMADLPANTPAQYPGDHGVVHYSEGVFVGYRHYDAQDIQPLFPFGFGLSYTTFAFKHLTIKLAPVSPGRFVLHATIQLDITNTGKRAGADVVELYVGIPSTHAVPEPPKQLKGFERLELNPGETGRANFELGAPSFAYWDVHTHGWMVAPGTYRIMVGSSSRETQLQGTIEVPASIALSGS